MIDFGYHNMDCMDGMKEIPDKFFDLAIVDPPYGDGGGTGQGVNASADGLTATATIPRGGGWHGKQKYHLGASSTKELPKTRRNMGLCELEERGRRNMQKKSLRGTLPRTNRTLTSCFASHVTKSFGAGIILTCRRQDAF